MNGYVPGSRVRVNLVIEYVADKKSGHDVVCFIKHVSALTSLVNEYSKTRQVKDVVDFAVLVDVILQAGLKEVNVTELLVISASRMLTPTTSAMSVLVVQTHELPGHDHDVEASLAEHPIHKRLDRRKNF
ncbi:hypothetical protein PR002_g12707 [Phytophthora rubi]|uniref:Uncharacterized protein n=1 Tax=Phytophthora rubi TaxID=129364 RepID=A0A6A3LNX6_9STRA|nr:hypothetical protein PR002_g12707 [Phytophthora rubi]